MRRMGSAHLRIAGALGGLIACAGAGVAVAADQRPAGAPLNPPLVREARAAPTFAAKETLQPAVVEAAPSGPPITTSYVS